MCIHTHPLFFIQTIIFFKINSAKINKKNSLKREIIYLLFYNFVLGSEQLNKKLQHNLSLFLSLSLSIQLYFWGLSTLSERGAKEASLSLSLTSLKRRHFHHYILTFLLCASLHHTSPFQELLLSLPHSVS